MIKQTQLLTLLSLCNCTKTAFDADSGRKVKVIIFRTFISFLQHKIRHVTCSWKPLYLFYNGFPGRRWLAHRNECVLFCQKQQQLGRVDSYLEQHQPPWKKSIPQQEMQTLPKYKIPKEKDVTVLPIINATAMTISSKMSKHRAGFCHWTTNSDDVFPLGDAKIISSYSGLKMNGVMDEPVFCCFPGAICISHFYCEEWALKLASLSWIRNDCEVVHVVCVVVRHQGEREENETWPALSLASGPQEERMGWVRMCGLVLKLPFCLFHTPTQHALHATCAQHQPFSPYCDKTSRRTAKTAAIKRYKYIQSLHMRCHEARLYC